jgi:adenine-specific DNA-methyltransferase
MILCLDFFLEVLLQSVTAHKIKRKWIGIEMGDHFDTVDLPRLKECFKWEKESLGYY